MSSAGHAASDASTASLAQLGREAVRSIEQGLDLPPLQLGEEVDVAERIVSRMRDRLIDALRRDTERPDAPRLRHALERVNVAISLLVGIEYPAAGIQLRPLEQARDVLTSLIPELEQR